MSRIGIPTHELECQERTHRLLESGVILGPYAREFPIGKRLRPDFIALRDGYPWAIECKARFGSEAYDACRKYALAKFVYVSCVVTCEAMDSCGHRTRASYLRSMSGSGFGVVVVGDGWYELIEPRFAQSHGFFPDEIESARVDLLARLGWAK